MACRAEGDRPMGVNRTLIAAAALAIFLAAGTINSCSYENPPLLEFDNRPDAPIDRYFAGRLGIIEQTYARSYLVVAYRYLSGHPLTAAEQKGVVALVKHRLALEPTRAADGVPLWRRVRQLHELYERCVHYGRGDLACAHRLVRRRQQGRGELARRSGRGLCQLQRHFRIARSSRGVTA